MVIITNIVSNDYCKVCKAQDQEGNVYNATGKNNSVSKLGQHG